MVDNVCMYTILEKRQENKLLVAILVDVSTGLTGAIAVE